MNDLQEVYKAIALEVQQKLAQRYIDRKPICKVICTGDKKIKIRLCYYERGKALFGKM